MQFTTPTPARLYQYTDKDAPRFDGAANRLILILKACLVTGYGDKQSAGWQVVEDNQDPVVQKTFVSPTQAGSLGVAVELKVSNDTGQQAKIQLMQSDTVRAECATAFMYKLGSTSLHTEKWCVIASDYGVWFFAEQANTSNIPQAQSGVYLYAGFTQSTTTGIRGLYIKHTGGDWSIGDDDRYSITDNQNPSGQTVGKLYLPSTDSTHSVNPRSLFTGSQSVSDETVLSPMVLAVKDGVFGLPVFGSSTNTTANQTIAGRHLCHSTALHTAANNVYVPLDRWEM